MHERKKERVKEKCVKITSCIFAMESKLALQSQTIQRKHQKKVM
jgi:hypothetical protein